MRAAELNQRRPLPPETREEQGPVTKLHLVETDNVIKLEPNRFLEAWELLPSTMKTRSLSRAKLRPIWDQHARRLGGQEALLAALQAYLKGDKDLPKSGGPGLQVWLRAEKYDHWCETGNSVVVPVSDDRPRFAEPFRSALVASCGGGWVISYVDQCSLDGTVLVVPAGKHTALSKIRENARQMREAGLTAVRLAK